MRAGFWFDVRLPCGAELRAHNLLTYDGQLAFLQKVFAESGELYDLGNLRTKLYVGLCDQVPTHALELSGVTTEPGSDGGYERKVWNIGAAATGNSFQRRNNFAYIEGPVITFAAAGAAYSRKVSRFFMTTAAQVQDSGVLLSISGPLPQSLTLAPSDAQGLSVRPSMGFFG